MSPYIFTAGGQSPGEQAFIEAGKALGIRVETNQSAYSADILISLPKEGRRVSEVTRSCDQGKPCIQLPVFGDADIPALVEEIIEFVVEHQARRVFVINGGSHVVRPLTTSEDLLMRLFVRTFSHPSLSISEPDRVDQTPPIMAPKRQARYRRAWKPTRRRKNSKEKVEENSQKIEEKSLQEETKASATIDQSSTSTQKSVRRGFFGQDPRKFVKSRRPGNTCGAPPPPPPPSFKTSNGLQPAKRRSQSHHPKRRIPPRR